MALVIALSLPGASKLAPYIHSIAGAHMNAPPAPPPGDPPGTTRRKSTVKAGPRASVAPRPSTFKFLQPVPDTFTVGQDAETNLLLQLDHTPGTVPASRTPERGLERPHIPPRSAVPPPSAQTQPAHLSTPQYPSHPPQPSAIVPSEGLTPARKAGQEQLEPRSVAQDVRALMAGLEEPVVPAPEDLVLSETSTGYIERASTSMAEVEIRHIMSELGPDSIQESPVYRALAGTFGRLQQSEHEAFLHMRTVCFYRRLLICCNRIAKLFLYMLIILGLSLSSYTK